MIKNIVASLLVSVLLVGTVIKHPIYAQSLFILTAEDALIDTSITREDNNYSTPNQIIITPIFSNEIISEMTSEQRFRGIYFYTVEYLGFSDIPYHYIIDSSGSVFEGNQGGVERKVKIDGIGDELILIGYMTDTSSTRFNYRAEDSIVKLLTKLANENNIGPDVISIENVVFNRNEESKTVTLGTSDLFGNWKSSLQTINAKVASSFQPTPKTYDVRVVNVTAPTEGVQPGDTIEVELTLENTGKFGLYGSSTSELLVTKIEQNESLFFLNNVWSSTTQVTPMDENEVLLPGEEKTFKFNVRVPLFIGDIAEAFTLRTVQGDNINSNDFEIKVSVKSSEKKIVEIQNTETGTLNVRSEPSSVASVVSTVSPGQRFFLVDQDASGWIKIQLNDGGSGWIAGWYVNYIN